MKPASTHLDHLPCVEITSRAQWRSWLEQHAESSGSIWLISYKKSRPDRYVSYDDIVEEALCFGWIDSTHRSIDEERSMLMITPRKPKSVWSSPNKKRVSALIEAGLMTDLGLRKINVARENGSWDALNDSDAGIIARDLAAALKQSPAARRHFDAFPPGARRVILQWIYSAKRPETRAARIAQAVDAAARNERAR